MDLNDVKETPPWEWTVETGEVLRGILQDLRGPLSDRVDAAELAGELTVMDDEMANLLLSIVSDAGEPEELRARAAISLGPALEEADMDGFDDDLTEPSISEEIFERIRATLRKTYEDEGTPKEVRRRVLEASVRASQDWHREAIRAAFSRDDEDWKLTATFCMGRVRGFDAQIMEMLESRNPDIHYEAVRAAGNWELDAAWPHVTALLTETTEKNLLLAAIEAAGSIRPREVGLVLSELADSEDEDIVEAVTDALLMAKGGADDEEEDEDSLL